MISDIKFLLNILVVTFNVKMR